MIMIIEEHLASIEDRHRHCAMVLVGNCINFFGNNIGPSVDSFWAHLTSGVQDTSVKVRQAACFSLSYWVVHPELLKKVASRIKVLAPVSVLVLRQKNIHISQLPDHFGLVSRPKYLCLCMHRFNSSLGKPPTPRARSLCYDTVLSFA